MAVAAPVEVEFNPFRNYLIPEESMWVRYSMQKAADFSKSNHLVVAHFISVTAAVLAVALSALNTLTYLFRMPLRILVNIVSLNPFTLIRDLVIDISSFARSFVFVSLGVTFIVAGVLFPRAIFPQFSPECCVSVEVHLKAENAKLQERITTLEEEKREYGDYLKIAIKKLTKIEASLEKKS